LEPARSGDTVLRAQLDLVDFAGGGQRHGGQAHYRIGDPPRRHAALQRCQQFLVRDLRLRPHLDLYIEGGEGWKNYAALGAQVANTPEWGAELMDEHFDPVVLRLVALLRKALPGCAEADIFWGYHFVTGGLMLTLARTGRIDKLSHGLCKSDDFVAVKERMASFMAAGMLRICQGN
jgi:hypothetical protein